MATSISSSTVLNSFPLREIRHFGFEYQLFSGVFSPLYLSGVKAFLSLPVWVHMVSPGVFSPFVLLSHTVPWLEARGTNSRCLLTIRTH